MNNIYQVIWSQVKQCYVVTSELAKRRGKGCGARSLRMAAVSMGVTAALLSCWTGVGTSVAHAESENVPGDSEITISENKSGVTYNLNGSNITFTVASGGSVHDIYGSGTASISLNTVYVYGTVSGSYVTGGYAFNGGEVTENTVTVSGDAALINGAVYGGNASNGLQASGSATGNKVFIYGGTVNGKDGVYGGYSYSRDANENEVTIEDGSVVSVKGGYSTARSGSAIKNRVTISGGTVTYTGVRAVVGGAGGSTSEDSVTQENEVIIKGNAKIKGSVIGGADAAYAAVVNKNTVTIKESAVIDGSMYGGYGNLNVKDKTENKVFIEGGSVSGNVYGGYITNYSMGASEEPAGNVKKNEVHITGGTVGTNDKTVIAGGYVEEYATGAAMDNAVTITRGTVKSRVFGGHVNNATSAATGNKLNISVADTSVADTVLERNAYGGYANGTGEVSENYVTITGGTLNYNVYAGYSVGGAARNNTVDISGKNTNVGFGVYGGYNYETNNAEFTVNNNTVKITDATIGGEVSGGVGFKDVFENRVEITGGKLGQMDAVSLVTGGDADDGSATKNEVEISGGTQLIGEVYGGYSSNSQTANNIVTIDNTTVKKAEEGYRGNVFGGSSQGDATGNRVTISGAETQVEGKVYGGNVFKSKVSADATGNTVEIKGGTIGKSDGDTVFGGYTNNGDSKQNNVIITGGTVNGDVFGGYSDSYNYIYGDSEQNNVNITGGTVNGNVYGGYSDSDASGNSVTISGGTVKGRVYGGYANSDATGNTVTLSNCTINGEVFGSWNLDGEMKNNTVNLTGKVSGLDGEDSDVSGCGWNNSDNTGNELHIGGTKDGSITGAWQGMTGDAVTNKITSVELFESIVYHNVKWDENVPALEVNTLSYVDAIDITNLAFDSLGTGTMALLKSGSDLSTIKLTYDDTHKDITITTDGVVLGGGGTEKTETTGEKGVKITRTVDEKVSLAKDSKAINYNIEESNNVTKITLGDVNTKDPRNMSGTGFDFTNTAKVDASGLKLVIEQPVDITKAVVPLVTNATNLKAGVAIDYGEGKTNHSQDISLTHDATGIAVGATMTGKVNTKAGEVDYLVTGATVNSLNLAGWNGAVVSETLVGVTGKTGGVTVTTGEFALPEISTESVTILTMNTDNFFGTVTGKRQYGDTTFANDEENGVILSGKQSGGVTTEDSGKKLTYYAMKNSAETMTFGEVEFKKDGVARDLKNAYTFDASSTIDATGLTFKETTEALLQNDSMTLAANAKGITSANKPTQPTNPDIAIAYTDKQGIKFGATAVGTVAAVTDAVQYTVDSVRLNSIDLASWSGTASAVPTGWSLKDGATVETDGMTAPKVEAGKSASIITSGTDNFFANAKINGANKYQETDFSEEDSGITFAGKQEKGVKAEEKNLVYASGSKNVSRATVTGSIPWNESNPYYKNTQYSFSADSVINVAGVTFAADSDPMAGSKAMTLITNANGKVEGSPKFEVKLANTMLEAAAEGDAAVSGGNLNFTVNGVTLNKVTVNGVGSDAIPEGWTAAENLKVDTSKMELPADMPAAGEEVTILKASGAIRFSDDSISDDNKYGKNPDRFTEEDKTQGAVVIAGKQDKGVATSQDGKSLVYKVGTKDASSVSLGTVQWASGSTLLDASDKAYNFADVTALAGSFAMNYKKPEDVAAKQSMTLLKANETLKDIAKEETNTWSYPDGYEPVAGVTMQGEIAGKLVAKDKAVTFTVDSNKATDLIFGKVEWKADGALIDHSKTLTNVSFDGATVDTSNIDFYKEMYIEADQTMTLVSNFGGEAKVTPESTKYMVGTAYEGESETKMEGNNLIIRTTTAAGLSEQTHKTVMAMEAGVALLAGGTEHVGKALESLGDVANQGSDGTSVGVSIGGSGNRYETGSHVNVNAWNAVVAVGAKRELKQGALEYGVFGEYGKGSYKLYNDDGGKGDGDAHYAGGGLMAKWTNKHDVYAEASFRLGRMSDSADNILEGGGNKYGYDVHANYYGAHVGIGKVFNYKGGKSLDVYGKYFYTKRDGVEYDAKQHYNLDSVASSVLRIGARYGTTDKKWNWYGGLAYEYEFDGEAKGTVNGTEIRAASIKGSSVRGEFGMRMDATKDNPWRTDISIYGYGGKHRGFGGSVNVAYTF